MLKRNTRRCIVTAVSLLLTILSFQNSIRPDTLTVAAAGDDLVAVLLPTSTPVNATPAPSRNDWENNQGSISLGTTIITTGKGVSTNGATVMISAGGDFTVTGTLVNGQIYVNTTEKVKLRLSGVKITNTTGPAIYIANAKKTFISITKKTDNFLSDGAIYSDPDAKGTIFSNDTLEIKGSGNLTVIGNHRHAIASDDDVIIENGTINITATVTDGIHANNNVTVHGGTLNIDAAEDCIDSEGDLVIYEGNFNLAAGNKAISSDLDSTINDGTIQVTKAERGLDSKANLLIHNGRISVTANDHGLSAGAGLTITGGTVIAMAASTSRPSDRTTTQCAVLLSGARENEAVTIQTTNGTEILNITPKKTYSTMLFTSPLLKLGQTYTMYINGARSCTFTTATPVTVAGGIVLMANAV